MAIATFTLTGTYQNLDGSPASGKVRVDVVSPAGGRVIDPDGNVVFAGPRTLVLDTAGHFSLTLPSDVTTGESTTIGYRVTAQLKHNNLAPVEFWAKASGSTWDIADIDTQVVAPLTATAVTTTDLDTRTATNINTAGTETQVAADARYATKATQTTVETGRLSDATLSGTYGPAAQVASPEFKATFAKFGTALGSQAAIFGDSLAYNGEGVIYWTAVLSKQRAFVRGSSYVVSHPGYTSGGLKPLTTEVTGLNPKPDFCMVIAGSNDIGSNIALATYQANMVSIFNDLRNAGIVPVLCTIPPRQGHLTLTRIFNAWLKEYAQQNHLPITDWNAAVVDPASGNYKTAMTDGDGIHPSNAGSKAIAQRVISDLDRLLPAARTITAQSSGLNNLQPNSNFLTDSNADGLADFLTATLTTGFTVSRVADPAGFQWQRITLSGVTSAKAVNGRFITNGGVTTTLAANSAAGATSLSVNASLPNGTYLLKSANGGETDVVVVTGSSGTGPYTVTLAGTLTPAAAHSAGDTITPCFEVGDRLLVAARVRSGQSGTNTKHTLQASFYNAGQTAVVLNRILTSPTGGMTQQIEDGVVYAELTVPAGAPTINLEFNVGPGDGTYDLAQPTIYNLTKMGL